MLSPGIEDKSPSLACRGAWKGAVGRARAVGRRRARDARREEESMTADSGRVAREKITLLSQGEALADGG